MFKDKAAQQAANRAAQAKFKAKQGITKQQGITQKVLPKQGITDAKVIPDSNTQVIPATGSTTNPNLPANYGLADCQCRHCCNNRRAGSKHIINHAAYKPAAELLPNELNRVSLPGDVDYAL
jgi:hypothetical protein